MIQELLPTAVPDCGWQCRAWALFIESAAIDAEPARAPPSAPPQDARSAQTFFLGQLQAQAAEVGQAAAAMPMRVARMEATLGQLESGDLKLRQERRRPCTRCLAFAAARRCCRRALPAALEGSLPG